MLTPLVRIMTTVTHSIFGRLLGPVKLPRITRDPCRSFLKMLLLSEVDWLPVSCDDEIGNPDSVTKNSSTLTGSAVIFQGVSAIFAQITYGNKHPSLTSPKET